ncbi:flavin monoamine oxidase family protein [Flavobacterium tiangeerense]|uniref:NAD(P)-binding protein n=1 Tax=Flavobacterium tiangeerense TaxID=459471 RepID=UPI0011AA24B5|nr:NAD(P)-binding protein [Flavobacterium tiangeerense]
MKNGENYNTSRRFFVKTVALALLAVPFLQACQEKVIQVLIRLSGTNHILGHRLRTKNFPKPTKQIHIPYLIVGGGISALSAARQFSKKGIHDFLVVELENHLGGNSSSGENKYSKYPLGAHYLPLPNKSDQELLDFLEEEAIIQGYDHKGFPIFDVQQLTFAPDERLFYRNNWQEGLVPKTGNTPNEDAQIQDFFLKMSTFRAGKDKNGVYYFDIPLSKSSQEPSIRALDKLTMQQWITQEGYTAQPLLNYIDYCCRDDFGLGIKEVSAWAGIHYFAARKQDTAPDGNDTVLTWPEGNARLASHLKKYTHSKTLTNHIVFDVKIENNKVIAATFDAQNQSSLEIIADKVIMATPQFVNQYFFKDRKKITKDFHYAPWFLATLVVSELPDNGSFPLCWDNVIYGSKGLGYIYDQHQTVQQIQPKKVITYYYSFSTLEIKKNRRLLYSQKENYWKQIVLDDLKMAHPTIESFIEDIHIHRLGHGMISPVPDFIFGQAKKEASASIDNRIFFAHSDLAGISIFEEAFHQGINIVNTILDGAAVD